MYKSILSNKIGIIKLLKERRVIPEFGFINNFVSHIVSRDSKVNGGGSFNKQKAILSAVGEAVERYCLQIYQRDRFSRATIEEMNFDREYFQWYLEEQYQNNFPILRVEKDWKLCWVEGFSIKNEDLIFLPASLVYLPYKYENGEHPLSYQYSVGTACASTREEAALKAILEVIERDAFTICWESHISYPRIKSEDWIQDIKTCKLISYDITTDLPIPSVLTIAYSPEKIPAVAIGSAASLDMKLALEKSIEEAITSWLSSNFIARSFSAKVDNPSFLNNAYFYSRSQNIEHFDFLIKSPLYTTLPFASVQQGHDFKRCCDILLQQGHDVILFDITSSDIETLGLKVVRAVIPTLVRCSLGHVRHLNNSRIYEVPYRLGYCSKPLVKNKIFKQFHPSP